MITLQKHRHQTREFRGPAPGSVAILARSPGLRGSTNIVDDMKKEVEYRKLSEELANDIRNATIRSEWEMNSQQKMISAAAFRQFNRVKSNLEEDVEKRREQLRNLIAQEHRDLAQEMDFSHETVVERQAKLREKAKRLKDEKALDNQMTAQMKYDQMWRDQCEQLRTTISKKTAAEIARDNLEMIRFKDTIAQERKTEDDYFTRLWYADIQKKEEREKQDAERAALRTSETIQIRDEQMALINANLKQEKKLKDEEKALRLEMLELKKLESENYLEEKLKKQQKTREEFDANLRLKLKRIHREVQEEIALDTKIMESLLQGFEAETNMRHEKKRKLMEDSKRYREYLARLKLQEEAREKELDEMMNEEIKKSWQRRIDQWNREAQARQKLLQEVIEIRRQQIEDKLRMNEENQKQAMIDRENFAKMIQGFKQDDIDRQNAVYEKNHKYKNDLLQQIAFNKYHEDMRKIAEENERESMKHEEEMFQKRIDATLSENWVDPRAHPWRKAALHS